MDTEQPPTHMPSMSPLTLIAAVSQNRVIGTADGQMPWPRIDADLRRFQKLTNGKPMVMGRTTFDSIGRVLPGRRSIVITRNPNWTHEGAEVANSVQAALDLAGDEPVMVIGGGTIYEQTIDLADRLEITWVGRMVAGSVKFPPIDLKTWRCVESVDQTGLRFATYIRLAR